MLSATPEGEARSGDPRSLSPLDGVPLPRSGRKEWWLLHAALGGLLALAFFALPAGTVAVSLLALLSPLLLVWTWWVVQGRAIDRSARTFIRTLIATSLALLALILMAAKWWIALTVPAEQAISYNASS